MLALIALTLQLQLSGAATTPTAVPPRAPAAADDDSLRDVGRAHDAQAGFERGRRYVLPWSLGGGGRCDVRVGRFCWWYEDGQSAPPAEPAELSRRRGELLAELDALGERRPGDPWIAGMRVYYRVDDRRPAAADSAARACRASTWWCTALVAYAAQARGDAPAADSGFTAAIAAMPDSTRCAWRDISTLLPAGARERYLPRDCAVRVDVEARYWMLATPRLSVAANEWRSEFFARRVAATLLAGAVTPHRLDWGRDTEELLLRYGWPVAWSRVQPIKVAQLEPDILGHDPAPSFHFGPPEAALDSGATVADDDAWRINDVHAESRFAHPAIRRIVSLSAQLARFRRADSTLVVAAWNTTDDSLSAPAASLGALRTDGRPVARALEPSRRGHGTLVVAGAPVMAGVELSDSATGSFARSRIVYAPRHDSAGVALSDILLYRPDGEQVPSLDDALALAIPGDTASVARPIGLYWESYGTDSAGTAMETTILVERVDHGLFRSARQRLGLAAPDSPVQVRWSEARPASGGVTGRALSLDLATLPAGRYRITLGATPEGRAGVTTAREVTLREP